MNLADRVAQCRSPFMVRELLTGRITTLKNTADYASQVASCPLRYVLTDDLARLCADLAYSKGARSIACADLLRVPAQTLWLEWCNEPWRSALQRYGFPLVAGGCQWAGRRGALLQAAPDGRRGLLRTFWTGGSEEDVLASSAEAYFDFETPEGEEPEPPGEPERGGAQVYDGARAGDDVLARCFRFRYEHSWAEYYARAALSAGQRDSLWRHALGTIAMDIPLVLAFFLLLAARSGLPQRPETFGRLNRSRQSAGKPPLLSHVAVRAPVLPEYRAPHRPESQGFRRGPRLHHVRGHLVRRGSQLFWRVPHLRGSARAGAVRTRTVVWTFDNCHDSSKSANPALTHNTPDVAAASLAAPAKNLQ